MARKKLSDKEKIKLLEGQLKESQQQAKYEKLKREAYETMIQIAEEELDTKTVPAGSKKSLARGAPRQTVQKTKL